MISPKTVGNHIEHIYAKIGASNRAAASLFAMQHGLLPGGGVPRGRRGLSAELTPACIACMFSIITAVDLAQLSLGAELDDLAARLVLDRDVARRQVEGVARLEDLVVVGEAIGEPAR